MTDEGKRKPAIRSMRVRTIAVGAGAETASAAEAKEDDDPRMAMLTKKALNSVRKIQMIANSNTLTDTIVRATDAYSTLLNYEKEGKILFVFDKAESTTDRIVLEPIRTSEGLTIGRNDPIPIVIDPIASKKQAVIYANILIQALHECIERNSDRLHNAPPLDLQIDRRNINEKDINDLIFELKKLNKLLSQDNYNSHVNEEDKIKLAAHLNKFFDGFVSVTGKGTGWLVIGVGASLLSYVGVHTDIVATILSKIK